MDTEIVTEKTTTFKCDKKNEVTKKQDSSRYTNKGQGRTAHELINQLPACCEPDDQWEWLHATCEAVTTGLAIAGSIRMLGAGTAWQRATYHD